MYSGSVLRTSKPSGRWQTKQGAGNHAQFTSKPSGRWQTFRQLLRVR